MKINNRSDFELKICIRNAVNQAAIELPKERFKIELYTKQGVSFAPKITMWSDDANVKRSEDNRCLIAAVSVCKDNYLPNGTLWCRLHIDEVNAQYADGIRHLQRPINTGVIIWEGDSEASTSVDVELLTTYYKGAPGRTPIKGEDYFTQEELEQVAQQAAGMVQGGDVTEQVSAAIDASAVRFDKGQLLSVQQQMQALANAGLSIEIISAAGLPRVLSDEQAERLKMASAVLLTGAADGDRLYCRGDVYKEYIYFYLLRTSALYSHLLYNSTTKELANVRSGSLRDTDAVHYIADNKTVAQRALARTNISAVGYLQLTASLGPEAENFPLTLTSTLAQVQAAYALFKDNPGRYRWSLSINSPATGNPLVEEAELEPLSREDGGWELLFTSKRSGRRYALVLTIENFAVTAVRVEYRMRPELRGCVEAGAAFNTQTGYWVYYDLTDLTDEQVCQMYAKWIRSGTMDLAYYNNKTLRANFAPIAGSYSTIAGGYLTFYNSNIEIAVLPSPINNPYGCFDRCMNLRKVYGSNTGGNYGKNYVNVSNAAGVFAQSMFNSCPALEWVQLHNIKASFNLSASTRLALECIEYMVLNAANTSAITLTFHPAVYTQISDELKAAAAAKNISIASA